MDGSNNIEVLFICPVAVWRWVGGSGGCGSGGPALGDTGYCYLTALPPPRGAVFFCAVKPA